MRVESGSDSEWLRPLQLQLNHECQKNAESSHQWLRPWPQGHSESLSLSEAVSITVSQTVTLFSCFGSRRCPPGHTTQGLWATGHDIVTSHCHSQNSSCSTAIRHSVKAPQLLRSYCTTARTGAALGGGWTPWDSVGEISVTGPLVQSVYRVK